MNPKHTKSGLKGNTRNGLMIFFAVIIVTGAFLLAEYRNKQSEKVAYVAPTVTPTDEIVNSQEEDSDADSLKDWEEVLLGTNPNNKDTDGDGTSDGEEVRLHRNPLIKGPKDGEKEVQNQSVKKAELAPIDLFARNFFARYMELKQAGVARDKASQEELASRVLKDGVVLPLPKTYAMKDILVSPDSSKEAVAKYSSEVEAVFKRNQNKGRDESVIAKESVEKENPNILKEIDPIISIYKNVTNSLLKIKVPEILAQNHLNMTNAMSGFLFVAESLRKTDKDALVALQGASRQIEFGRALGESLGKIRNNPL